MILSARRSVFALSVLLLSVFVLLGCGSGTRGADTTKAPPDAGESKPSDAKVAARIGTLGRTEWAEILPGDPKLTGPNFRYVADLGKNTGKRFFVVPLELTSEVPLKRMAKEFSLVLGSGRTVAGGFTGLDGLWFWNSNDAVLHPGNGKPQSITVAFLLEKADDVTGAKIRYAQGSWVALEMAGK